QDYVGDVALTAHRKVGAAPRKAWRVVVAPDVQEPSSPTRHHNLEVTLRTARSLDEQTTTTSHNPILLSCGQPHRTTVPAPGGGKRSQHAPRSGNLVVNEERFVPEHRSARVIAEKEEFDVVVVGGGAAGCVVAARLSESGS